uniref:Sugar or nucleoside kinase, ribokinase family n=2 Tax=Candidatus Kentrum sp. SD TaxID=2126332 RepID=A0A450YYD8_9GAMM|nr:MAG: Sugar or nucleoside kinase, ribokinase family [Candidatus Kentron sp. SD]
MARAANVGSRPRALADKLHAIRICLAWCCPYRRGSKGHLAAKTVSSLVKISHTEGKMKFSLPYSLIIEATDEPNLLGFFSPDLEGFIGSGHSIEHCIDEAGQGMIEHIALLEKNDLPVPPANPKARIIIQPIESNQGKSSLTASIRNMFEKLFRNASNEKIARATARLIPIVGSGMAELIPDKDIEKIIGEIHGITVEQTELLTRRLQEITQDDGQRENCGAIAIVGSGNLEMLLHSPRTERIILGEKHSVRVETLWGGSGVNFARRLLSTGHIVLPVLPIAEDHAGKQIRDAMKMSAREGGIWEKIHEYWGQLKLFNSSVKTPTSVLVIHESERTAFRQQAKTKEGYPNQLKAQIDSLYSFCDSPSALLVGHVPRGNESPESIAEVLDYLLGKYRNRTLIYAVLGSSQLQLGWKFWETRIKDDIDIFQLNLSEAKRFFSDGDRPATVEIVLDHLREMNVSTVLTMDKFGAIATFSRSNDIFVVWPLIDSSDVYDSTGAGDAFAAGMISVLAGVGKGFSGHDFETALAEGAKWAGAACRTAGGSGYAPGKELSTFIENNTECKRNNVETRKYDNTRELLRLVDLAYPVVISPLPEKPETGKQETHRR